MSFEEVTLQKCFFLIEVCIRSCMEYHHVILITGQRVVTRMGDRKWRSQNSRGPFSRPRWRKSMREPRYVQTKWHRCAQMKASNSKVLIDNKIILIATGVDFSTFLNIVYFGLLPHLLTQGLFHLTSIPSSLLCYLLWVISGLYSVVEPGLSCPKEGWGDLES